MKATLQHLSGSRRGHSDVVEKERFTIGTAPDCDVCFSAAADSRASDYQAEISYENCEYYLRDLRSASGTFVNGVQVTEIIISDVDLIEFGLGGPKVRFLVRPDDHLACKPFREILSDSRALAAERSRNPTVTATVFTRALVRGLIREASPRAKVIAVTVAVGFVASIIFPIYSSLKTRQEYRRGFLQFSTQIQHFRGEREQLAEQVRRYREQAGSQEATTADLRTQLDREKGELERKLATLRQESGSDGQHIKEVEVQLARTRKRLSGLERESAFSERVAGAYAGSVAFLLGSYHFEDPATGRPLRFAGIGPDGAPLRSADGGFTVSLEGTAPIITRDYTATGFVVAPGRMLTNRHVAEPWSHEEEDEKLIAAGLRAAPDQMLAYFPDQPSPVPLEVESISDQADVAVCRFDPGLLTLPVLRTNAAPEAVTIGGPVILIGYPAGFSALLARIGEAPIQEIVGSGARSPAEITKQLAERKLIRPLVTQGHIGDISGEVLVYDAATTSGGSGSPILNRKGEVIGVNSAILPGFGGSNMGVPIKFAIELLEKSTAAGTSKRVKDSPQGSH